MKEGTFFRSTVPREPHAACWLFELLIYIDPTLPVKFYEPCRVDRLSGIHKVSAPHVRVVRQKRQKELVEVKREKVFRKAS